MGKVVPVVVTCVDRAGYRHEVEVPAAESVYEAIAVAYRALKESEHTASAVDLLCRFEVRVPGPTVTHHLRAGQVVEWVRSRSVMSPAETMRRVRVGELLGVSRDGEGH